MFNKLYRAGVVAAAVIATVLGTATMSPASAAPPPYGGDLLVNSGYECTAGIPARSRTGQWYIVTAGHCLGNRPSGNWTLAGTAIGTTARWEFGIYGPDGGTNGWDTGAIRSSKVLAAQVRSTSAVYTLTGHRNPTLGERVCMPLGKTRRTACGPVTNANFNALVTPTGFPTQRIYNLANVAVDNGFCPVAGDSGSPALVGTVAVGFISGGSGCNVAITRLEGVLDGYGLDF